MTQVRIVTALMTAGLILSASVTPIVAQSTSAAAAAQKVERPERPNRPGRPDRPDRRERPERPDRRDRPEHLGKKQVDIYATASVRLSL